MSDEATRPGNAADDDEAKLAAFLEGDGAADPQDAEIVGLFREAAGAQSDAAQAQASWARVAESAPAEARVGTRKARALRWVGLSVAAAAAAFFVLTSVGPPAAPPGATVAELREAMEALDPAFGSPAKRLEALDRASAAEAERLLHGLRHGLRHGG